MLATTLDREFIDNFKAQAKLQRELVLLCKGFIKDQDIHCEDVIYQSDRVIENAYTFINKICDIVGYNKEEE